MLFVTNSVAEVTDRLRASSFYYDIDDEDYLGGDKLQGVKSIYIPNDSGGLEGTHFTSCFGPRYYEGSYAFDGNIDSGYIYRTYTPSDSFSSREVTRREFEKTNDLYYKTTGLNIFYLAIQKNSHVMDIAMNTYLSTSLREIYCDKNDIDPTACKTKSLTNKPLKESSVGQAWESIYIGADECDKLNEEKEMDPSGHVRRSKRIYRVRKFDGCKRKTQCRLNIFHSRTR